MRETHLARFLGCSTRNLPRLGLCRRPDPDSPTFQSDIRRVADAFGLHADRLIQLIREMDALDVLGNALPGTGQEAVRGLLIAARDRKAAGPRQTEPADGRNRCEQKES